MGNIRLAAAGFVVLAGVVALVLSAGRAALFESGRIERITEIFEAKTRSFSRGDSGYPLPPAAAGRQEIAYLEELAAVLESHRGDCPATEDLVRQLARSMRSEWPGRTHRSLFREAARLQRLEQDRDFVHDLSGEISDGIGVSLRRRRTPVPEDVREQIKILKAKNDRIDLVRDAASALRRLLRAAGPFASDCPTESEALNQALGYLLGEPGS